MGVQRCSATLASKVGWKYSNLGLCRLLGLGVGGSNKTYRPAMHAPACTYSANLRLYPRHSNLHACNGRGVILTIMRLLRN